nr:MAG TPA: hypothetical protein [Caudoviricetes sp.]
MHGWSSEARPLTIDYFYLSWSAEYRTPFYLVSHMLILFIFSIKKLNVVYL